MYLDEAMRAPDNKQFCEAMSDEVKSHVKWRHWVIMLRSQLPEGTQVLPAVWAFRRKRHIDTQEVYK
jgi:hypothetical protein